MSGGVNPGLPSRAYLARLCSALSQDFATAAECVHIECNALTAHHPGICLRLFISRALVLEVQADLFPGEWHIRLPQVVGEAQDEVIMFLRRPWPVRPGHAVPLIPDFDAVSGHMAWIDAETHTPVVRFGSL
jgi:hypothetical protein